MGLVEASIVTTRAIELFKPRVIAMSGICAGMAGNSKLGTLVLADMCWEYQAGKWSDTGFKIEHYDVPLHSAIRTTLNQLIASDPKGTRYKENLIEDPVVFKSIIVAPMSTGSAVVASAEQSEKISEHSTVRWLR